MIALHQRNFSNRNEKVSFSSLNQQKFSRIFPVFLANTDEKPQMVRAMRPVFSRILDCDWLKGNSLRVLDIGCGDGFTAEKIYGALQEMSPGVKIHAKSIDNNARLLASYRARFADSSAVDVVTQKKDIFGSKSFKEAADLGIASHSLYHAPVGNLGNVLSSLYASVEERGVAVISLLRGDSDFNLIQKNFGAFVTDKCETNPVSTELRDVKKAIDANSKLSFNSASQKYPAYVYFPSLEGGFDSFKNWQLKNPDSKAPTPEHQKTLDLLEFVVHGDLQKLRQKGKLVDFFAATEKMFKRNGKDEQGHDRINFNGENIFLFG